ncbi:hypothetical protein Tco_0607415, partial [Tanacetum coccineum]
MGFSCGRCGHNLDIAPATYVINKSPRAKLV